MTFSDLDLRPELAQTVADLGYEAPSPIQEALIPVLLTGRDAIGQARTGTGKTAAFALPMLQRLAETETRGIVRALVLCPTRELAVQVSGAIYQYGRELGVRTLPIYGGQAYHKQTRRLEQGVDIVVATPGRLVDLLDRGAVDLSAVETVVLDEADEMLSMGFADDLETILQGTPGSRQTALLSATLPPRIRHIASTYLRDPETISTTDGDKTAADVEQRGYVVHHRDKLAAMLRLLETEDVTSALAFVKTRHATTALAADLTRAGWAAEPISGELSQAQRNDVLHRFRNGDITILVGTDVAARGLDVDHVSHVFNVDLPIDIEAYVHRVGRTGRAGRSGVALSLVAPGEAGLIERIQRYVKREIPATPLPTVEEVEAVRAERLTERMREAMGNATDADRVLVMQLVSEGHDPMTIAAAALAIAREDRKEAPVMEIAPPRSRGHRNDSRGHRNRPARPHRQSGAREEGMVSVAIAAGRRNGVEPRHVVATVARTADIPGRALGKITITDNTTFVDVPADLADRVLAQDTYQFGKRRAGAERA
ncbi:MAG: DEAD/DEAH box helicase [Bacteroidota bacterium]